MAQNQVDSVNDLLTCVICMEKFDDEDQQPKLLACHHSFCKHCLLRLAKNNSFIQCPTCREKVSLPCDAPEGVHRLQTNFYVAQMQELLGSSHNIRGKNCKKHQLSLTCFCRTCEVAICEECSRNEHQESGGHLVVELAQAEREQKRLLETEIAEAHHIVTVNGIHLKTLDSEMANMFSAKDRALQDIHRAFDEYVALINQRRQEILTKANESFLENKKILTDHSHTLKQQVTSLLALSDQCQDAISQSSISDLLAYKSKMASRNQEIRSENRSRQYHDLGNNYMLFKTDGESFDFEEVVSGMGSVSFSDPLPSVLKLVQTRCVASLFVTLELIVRSHKGDELQNYPITAEILDPCDDIVPSLVQHRNNGHYEITFRPQVSGTHYLTVSFNDYPMPGGNFVIPVESNDPVDCIGERGTIEATMEYPRAVAIDNRNNMYVMDSGNCRIQKFDKMGNFLFHVPISEENRDYSSCGVAVNEQENLLVCTEVHVQDADMSDARSLLLYSTSGQLLNRFTYKDLLRQALSVAINNSGQVIVVDSELNCAFVFDRRGRLVTKFGSTGCGPGEFRRPMFVCVDKGDNIYISDGDNNRIQVFDKRGKFMLQFGESGNGKGQFIMPFGIATDYHDNILVVDGGNKRIQIFKNTGQFVSCIESHGEPMQAPRGIAVTTDGHVVVADRDNHCIKKFKYLHCTTL